MFDIGFSRFDFFLNLCPMSEKQMNLLFWMGLFLTAVGVLALYVLDMDLGEMDIYYTKIILYLSGLSTIYFGWKKIEHKFPDKRK